MQSWELLSEVLISLRESLKNISEGKLLERIQQPQSLPATHKGQQATAPGASTACRGWDHPWGPATAMPWQGKQPGSLWVPMGGLGHQCHVL